MVKRSLTCTGETSISPCKLLEKFTQTSNPTKLDYEP